MTIPTPARRRTIARLAVAGLLLLGAALPAVAVPAAGQRAGFAGSSGTAARTPSGARAALGRVGPTVPGIDVSHWQGPIGWAKVAGDGKRFAFLKATDDVHDVDPTFAANRADARAAGLSVGAYHFARPDPSPGDARREARFFVSVADPQPGDLLPVLDIETSRDLNHGEVTAWARTWVAVVRRLTGVTPLVYTSPYGWATRTGDTPLLARDGAPLWVAHWGVPSPTVPADDWDGRGWLVWQYSSTGHVPGISGNADLDRVAGTDLGAVTIRRLSIAVEGGTGRVTSSPPGSGCSAACSGGVDPGATITLTAVPDDQARFTGWTGACDGTAPTCTIEMSANRTVGARFVTDITAPTPDVAAPANLVGPAVVDFDEAVRGVTSSSLQVRADGGPKVPVSRRCRSGSGAVVPCDATTVRSVSLTPVAPLVPGRDYVVLVNPAGASPAIRDAAGNAAAPVRTPFATLRSVEQTSPAVTKRPAGAWGPVHVAAASSGSYTVTGRANAAIRMAFDGTGVDWTTVTGPNRGRARVYLDGASVRTVDLFSRSRTFDVLVPFTGLPDGAHLLRIVVTGRGRPGSDGSLVAVDRLDVLA
jgi:GH25 family lysozyme M1 (1,4-beta-N-acetylmuramidase)